MASFYSLSTLWCSILINHYWDTTVKVSYNNASSELPNKSCPCDEALVWFICTHLEHTCYKNRKALWRTETRKCRDDKEYCLFNCSTIIHANDSWVEKDYKGHRRKASYSVFSEWVIFRIFHFKDFQGGIQRYSPRIFPNDTKVLVPKKSITSKKKVDWVIDFCFFYNT